MQKDDVCRVITDRDGSHSHQIGTLVTVLLIGNKETDPEPYYCKTLAGNTCYWYGEEDLEVIERMGLV